MMIKKYITWMAVLLCGVTLLFAGCNKQDNSKANYQTAINDYYKAHPVCLWQDTKKFPVQAATSDDAKTEGYDALTDAGLLTRTTGGKEGLHCRFQAGEQLRSVSARALRLDAGYGPARIRQLLLWPSCCGFIDSFTAGVNGSGLKTAEVNYHYSFADVPGWAKTRRSKQPSPLWAPRWRKASPLRIRW